MPIKLLGGGFARRYGKRHSCGCTLGWRNLRKRKINKYLKASTMSRKEEEL